MIECNISSKGRKTAKTINHVIVNSINQSISDLLQTLALAACCGGQMMEELKKLDISPDNIEGVEQYTDLSIDEIITQALGGIDRKWVIPMNCRHGYIIKKKKSGIDVVWQTDYNILTLQKKPPKQSNIKFLTRKGEELSLIQAIYQF